MLKEFAVISVPSLVIDVTDGMIESVFPTADQALHYIEIEKPKYPDRRYGIREMLRERRLGGGRRTSDGIQIIENFLRGALGG